MQSTEIREQAVATIVCEACRMKIPGDIEAKAHLMVHGPGHEPHIAFLTSQGVSVHVAEDHS